VAGSWRSSGVVRSILTTAVEERRGQESCQRVIEGLNSGLTVYRRTCGIC
jgi:hypothetical protein